MGVILIKKYNFTKKDRKTGKISNCGFMNLDTSENRASLCFYGDICGSAWQSKWSEDDKAPQDVADFLSELDNSTKPLDVFINSCGGDVFGGIAIYNILKRYQGEKTAHIDGIAASIAGIIPFACDKVIAPKSAQIMLHKPWSFCSGNADDMRKCIESLDMCEKSIINIYLNHVVNGTTEEEIKSMIDRETWLTCEEASKYFNIEIEDSEPVSAYISDYFTNYRHIPENLKLSEDSPEIHNRKRKLQLEHDLLRLRNEVKKYD